MALTSGTFVTPNARGIREDLQDAIYNVSPEETPFLSAIKRMKGTATTHEWQVDALAAATVGNAQLEGDESAINTSTATTRHGNYMQIARKVPRVSGTLRAVNTAGRRDELMYQVMEKRMPELKLDVEKTLLGKQAGVARQSATAGVCAGVGRWLYSNTVKAGGTTSTTAAITTVPTNALTEVAASAAALTETHLQTLMQSIWTNGGKPTMILANAFNKRKISGFGGIATLYKDVGKTATIVGAADRYVSDFGELMVVPCRQMRTNAVYVIDPEYWAAVYLRPFSVEDQAKTGDADKRLLLVEFTLAALNQKSSGKIYNTTTS